MSEKIRTTIALDKSLYEKARLKAEADARSFNSLIIKLLQDYVKSEGGN